MTMHPMLTPAEPDDAAGEAERSAFNAAFYELGLRWHWDSDEYRTLAAVPCERERVRGYLESAQAHMLRAYDADFLTDAILTTKQRCRGTIAKGAPRALPRCNWADARRAEVGF